MFIKDKPNRSRYIEELIKQDIQQQNVKPITRSVASELLADESFFRELSGRVRSDSRVPMTPDNPSQLTASPITSPNPEPFVPKPPDPITGYPCCQLNKPCKHWTFNGLEGVWVNELTGKTRSVEG